jgi:hypothetical protein
LVDREFLVVDHLLEFVGQHPYDIILFIIVGVRVLAVSKANLRVILIACLLLICVFYIGGIVSAQLAGPDTSMLVYLSVVIGIRLVALKIIFTVVDWEE